MAARNRFKRLFGLLLCGLGLFTFGCKTEQGISPYSVQYGVVAGKEQLHTDEVYVDSTQFADGKYRYFLSGTITNDQSKGHFTLCTEGRPGTDGTRVLSDHLEFGERARDSYACTMFRAEKDQVIEWRDGTKLLRVVIRPTSEY